MAGHRCSYTNTHGYQYAYPAPYSHSHGHSLTYAYPHGYMDAHTPECLDAPLCYTQRGRGLAR